jgi:transposase
MAMELSAGKWHLVFGVGLATPVRHRTMAAGAAAQLQEEVRRARARYGQPADAPVRSCHEAGRDGFWVHRLLTRAGIENLVVDSSSIEVTRRPRRAKTDRVDATRLFRKLVQYWGGDRDTWKVVHVPSEALEDARQAERGIATLTAERTTWRNRIHGLLMLAGVRTPITADFGERLASLCTWAGAPLPPGLRVRLGQAWRMLTASARRWLEGRCRHDEVDGAALFPQGDRRLPNSSRIRGTPGGHCT